jgi:4-hydroxybenzoate polyprenyltransferase
VVTGLAVALGVAVDLPTPRLLLLAGAVLTGQLSIGWLNDLHDLDDDVAAGRRDKPLATGAVRPAGVRAAFWSATGATVALSATLGPRPGVLNLVTVACGWAYDLRLKRTVWSWLPFLLAFGLLPAVVVLSAPPPAPTPPWWGCLAGGLLGVGAHAANALPDIEADLARGVGGLPARLGPRGTRLLAGLALAGATVLLALAPEGRPGLLGWFSLGLAGLLLGAGVVRRWPARSRAPFVIVALVAVVDVVLLVARAGTWVPTG